MTTSFRLSVLTAACLSATYSSLAIAEAPTQDTKTLATIVVTASREGNLSAIPLLQLAKLTAKH